jgi:hypothetical protein
MTIIEMGRLLRASTVGCVMGCRVSSLNAPVFGGMVRIPLGNDTGDQVYGLIYDIHIDDDGLVRQLVTAEHVSEDVILDNRVNRNVPVEISVLFVGFQRGGQIYHLLPPRPPLTLDAIYPCSEKETCDFISAGHFGYYRHILRPGDFPAGELLAAHIQLANCAQQSFGNTDWVNESVQELITLLRDDYPTLMAVLGALSDARIV